MATEPGHANSTWGSLRVCLYAWHMFDGFTYTNGCTMLHPSMCTHGLAVAREKHRSRHFRATKRRLWKSLLPTANEKLPISALPGSRPPLLTKQQNDQFYQAWTCSSTNTAQRGSTQRKERSASSAVAVPREPSHPARLPHKRRTASAKNDLFFLLLALPFRAQS